MAYSDSDDSNPKIGDERAEKTLESNESIPHTKRTYRLQTWKWVKRLYDKHSGFARYINRKIPLFPDAEKAANLLAETPEFKEATSIKVNIDRAQEAVKLHVLKSKKTLFVAPTQKSEYLYAKIKAPENLDEIDLEQVQNQNIVKVLARGDTYEELGIDQAEPLDMIVVGCVAVSERGQRIGKGNGIVDLEIAILHSLGVITPKTVIATTVADEQVYPAFDPVLFQNYDFTVDLIVTPSRVIRVEPRPEQRTIGVQWDLLSARRLEILRVLKPLKKRLEDEGQKIELKEEGSDVESIAKRRTRGSFNGGSVGGGGGVGGGQKKGRRSKRGLKKPAYDRPDDDAEPEPNQNQNRNRNENQNRTGGDGGDTQQPRKRRNNKDGKMRSFRNNYRKSGSGENAGSNSGRDARVRPIKPPRQLQDSVRIRVSNMFSVPFKQFKEELRKRDCYPAKISQSRNGRCQLIFPKREDTEEQVQVNELLQKLTDMHISVPDKNTNEPKQIWLRCDLQPKPGEFDENDVVFITSAANQAAKKATAACMKLATTTTSQTVTDPDANTKTNSTTTTTTTSHLNLEELTAEVNAATLLAARAAKAAEVIAEKVLQEAKPAVEAESAKEDNKEHSAKLLAQVETLTKAGADALAASKKAEAAAVATTTTAAADATKPANEAANAKDDSKEQTTAKVDADATGTKAETAATAESVAAKKEAIIAMSDAIQAAARATAAVSFAVATLYLLLPPATTRPHTVMVPSMRSLRFFGAILPKVVP